MQYTMGIRGLCMNKGEPSTLGDLELVLRKRYRRMTWRLLAMEVGHDTNVGFQCVFADNMYHKRSDVTDGAIYLAGFVVRRSLWIPVFDPRFLFKFYRRRP